MCIFWFLNTLWRNLIFVFWFFFPVLCSKALSHITLDDFNSTFSYSSTILLVSLSFIFFFSLILFVTLSPTFSCRSLIRAVFSSLFSFCFSLFSISLLCRLFFPCALTKCITAYVQICKSLITEHKTRVSIVRNSAGHVQWSVQNTPSDQSRGRLRYVEEEISDEEWMSKS